MPRQLDADRRPVVCDWCGHQFAINADDVPDGAQCPICGEPVTPL
jgi:rubrerythrin